MRAGEAARVLKMLCFDKKLLEVVYSAIAFNYCPMQCASSLFALFLFVWNAGNGCQTSGCVMQSDSVLVKRE